MADAPNLKLQVLQRGKEVTEGTAVAATHRVPFDPGSLEWDAGYDRIRRRYSGSAATSHSSSTGLQTPSVKWSENGTYDYLAVLLETFLGAATITDPNTDADKLWTFLPSDSSPNNLVRHTLEIGGRDTWAEEEKFAGCVGKSLKITWNKSDDVKLAIEMASIRNSQASKTSSLTLPATLVPILGRLARVYIDTSTFGSTSFGRAIEGELTIENDLSQRFGSDGNDYANRIAVKGRTVTASLTVEYDATTLRSAWRAGTLEKLRLSFPGPTLGASTYGATFDIPGTWDASKQDDDDGIATIAMDLTAEYNSSLGADIKATVVCSIDAVP